jgi:hypothetical protein
VRTAPSAQAAADARAPQLAASTPDAARAKPAATPNTAASAYAGSGRFGLQSADGRFAANLHGVMQFDAAHYAQDNPGPIATDLRRGGAALF